MTFQFESFAAFVAMNNHGPYVWAAYAITLAVLVILVVTPVLQTRSFFRRQRRLQRLAEKQTGQSALYQS